MRYIEVDEEPEVYRNRAGQLLNVHEITFKPGIEGGIMEITRSAFIGLLVEAGYEKVEDESL